MKKQVNTNHLAVFLLLFMMFLYPAINNYVWRVIYIVFPISIDTVNMIAWILAILFSLPYLLKHIKYTHVLFYLLISAIAIVFFLVTDYRHFTSEALRTMLFGVFPAFILGAVVEIDEAVYKPLSAASKIVLLVSIAYTIYFLASGRILHRDNMMQAYVVLPSVLILMSELFQSTGAQTKKKKGSMVFFTVIGVVFIVALGTRGPIVCIVTFVAIMLYKKFGLSKLLIPAVAGVVGILLFVNSPAFISLSDSFAEVLEDLGFSSRIIDMMQEDNLADGNGRNAIMEFLLNDIREEPLKIRGPYADRAATVGLYDKEYTTIYRNGSYAHNVLLELVYNYGVIIGFILILLIGGRVFGLVKRSNARYSPIVTTTVVCGLVYLFFSGSYLEEPFFFLLLGLTANKQVLKSADEKYEA